MRAHEFISEDIKASKIRLVHKNANPGAFTGVEIDRYYDVYRAGMLMARAPDNFDDLDKVSWLNNQPYFGAYTEVDADKINAALKALKIKPKKLIEPGSEEHPAVHITSPVKAFKGY